MLATLVLGAAGFATQRGGRLHLSGRSRSRSLCCSSAAGADDNDAAANIRPASACWIKKQSCEMLQRFGSAFEDAADKEYAYENLLLSRSQDALLDAALLEVASTSSSRLAQRRYPVRLPSKRATVGCYGRLLAEMDSGRLQAEPEPKPESGTEPVSGPAARRSDLMLLLRWCTYGRGEELRGGGVWKLKGEVLGQSGLQRIGQAYGTPTGPPG